MFPTLVTTEVIPVIGSVTLSEPKLTEGSTIFEFLSCRWRYEPIKLFGSTRATPLGVAQRILKPLFSPGFPGIRALLAPSAVIVACSGFCPSPTWDMRGRSSSSPVGHALTSFLKKISHFPMSLARPSDLTWKSDYSHKAPIAPQILLQGPTRERLFRTRWDYVSQIRYSQSYQRFPVQFKFITLAGVGI